MRYHLAIDDQKFEVEVGEPKDNQVPVIYGGRT